jgi:hypothetical protein
MIIKPMPSPGGTNREKLFILQGGKGTLNRRGAYDSRRGAPTIRWARLRMTISSRSLPGRKKI